MTQLQQIDTIIYDLDGTIIDTEQFHIKAWTVTAQEYSLGYSGEHIYAASKGISSKKTLENLLPQDRYAIIPQAAESKFQHMMRVMENEPVSLLAGFEETFAQLQQYGVKIGICTSARKENVNALQQNKSSPISEILRSLAGKIAWKEMFNQGKPSAEPLLLALNLVDSTPQNALYIGDAVADYGCAKNASTEFVYFCPQGTSPEKEIPESVPRIQNHPELLGLIKF